jgi:parallel beta-helix repeat protein
VRLALEGHKIFPNVNGMFSAISNSDDGFAGAVVTDVHILGPGLIVDTTFLFGCGVCLVSGVSDSEVSGITVQGSNIGIFAGGPLTTGLTFTRNTIVGASVGISVTTLNSTTISENVATGCTVGIEIMKVGATSSPIKLSGNKVIGNRNTGVDINESGFVTAQHNIVSGNGTVGINVASSLGFNQIINNAALANGTLDLNDADPNCVGTVWSGNTFFTANPKSCIH